MCSSDLKAAEFEKYDPISGKSFTWIENESLHDLAKPERVQQIKADYAKKMQQNNTCREESTLKNIFSSETTGQTGCLICHL